MAEHTASDAIIRRIRGLLRLAESSKGTPESDTAAAAACRLLAKYGITEADVYAQEPVTREVVFPWRGPGWEWQAFLVTSFGMAAKCDVGVLARADHGVAYVTGEREGVDWTVAAFTYVVGELRAAWRAEYDLRQGSLWGLLSRHSTTDKAAEGTYLTNAAGACVARMLQKYETLQQTGGEESGAEKPPPPKFAPDPRGFIAGVSVSLPDLPKRKPRVSLAAKE